MPAVHRAERHWVTPNVLSALCLRVEEASSKAPDRQIPVDSLAWSPGVLVESAQEGSVVH